MASSSCSVAQLVQPSVTAFNTCHAKWVPHRRSLQSGKSSWRRLMLTAKLSAAATRAGVDGSFKTALCAHIASKIVQAAN